MPQDPTRDDTVRLEPDGTVGSARAGRTPAVPAPSQATPTPTAEPAAAVVVPPVEPPVQPSAVPPAVAPAVRPASET